MSTGPLAFNSQAQDSLPQTPSLESVIRRAMRQVGQSLRVCLPGQVVHVDSRHRVDVQPLLQARFAVEAQPTTLKPICGVPVSQPAGQLWAFSGPVAVGDTGLLVFADRSLDNWLAGDGGVADPNDGRCHHISDAIFMPGLMSDGQAVSRQDSSSDLTVSNGAASLRLQQAGTLSLGNGVIELVSLVGQLANAVSTLSAALTKATVTIPGPTPTIANVISTASTEASDAVALKAQQLKGP